MPTGDNLKVQAVASLGKKTILSYKSVGLMRLPIVSGQANDCQLKQNGSMLAEADSKMQSMHGEMKTYVRENPKPILGKVLFLKETIRVMASTRQHLSKAIRQTATAYMIWQATYGNGAPTYTMKTIIKL